MHKTQSEVWRKSPLAPDHIEISNHGGVRSLPRLVECVRIGAPATQVKRGCVFSPYVADTGYPMVQIKIGCNRRKYLVHRLVASAFCAGYDPSLTVNHKNGNKLDNRAENLEWLSSAENSRHQWRIGLANLRGDNQPTRKLHSTDVLRIRADIEKGVPVTQIAKQYGVCSSNIYAIKIRKRWASV